MHSQAQCLNDGTLGDVDIGRGSMEISVHHRILTGQRDSGRAGVGSRHDDGATGMHAPRRHDGGTDDPTAMTAMNSGRQNAFVRIGRISLDHR